MKKGISLMVLVASVVIMSIIITTTLIYSGKSIDTAKYERFKYEFLNVSNFVNAYFLENEELPITNESISPRNISDDFLKQIILNGDNEDNLFIINMKLLKNLNIKIGNGNFSNRDIFVVSERNHNIYYIKGYKYKGKLIYKI